MTRVLWVIGFRWTRPNPPGALMERDTEQNNDSGFEDDRPPAEKVREDGSAPEWKVIEEDERRAEEERSRQQQAGNAA